MGQLSNTAVIFVASGVVDGGGFWLDADGKAHRIPPWDPETLAQLTVGATILNNAKNISNPSLSRHFETIAQEVITEIMAEVEHHLDSAVS